MLMLLLGIVAVTILIYYYVVKPLRYWKERGVESGQPKWVFGHFWENFTGKKNGAKIFDDSYKQYPEARYTGMYRFSTPVFMVRDPDLIKQITVKDFDSFADHTEIVPTDHDPLWAKNLLNMSSTKWKNMRNHLSPSFTSSKMRGMFKLMSECAENLMQHLLAKKEDVITVEMRDLFSRYTNDVIATSAFGLKLNSITQPNNEFYKMSNEVSDITDVKRLVKMLLYWFIPSIKNVFKIQVINDTAGDYFRGIIDDAIKTREEQNIKRPDMLHLLLEARKGVEKQKETGAENIPDLDLSDEVITAQAVVFIIAGFESVSSFICFATYELALNPDVQEKLKAEISDTLEECQGEVTYEALLKMKYLDMVLSESLRKWPSFIGTDRIVTKPYTIQPVAPGEKPVHLDVNTEIVLPIFSIHHDATHFPDPERFEPERFSDENKGNIHPYSYFPFGVGPRNCIGSRFAVLEAKVILFHLLSKFDIVPVKKTQIPLKFTKNSFFNLKPEGGIWCGFKQHTIK